MGLDAVASLADRRDRCWAVVLESSKFCQAILDGSADRQLIADYMAQTVHYAVHNPRHQALIACRSDDMPLQYRRFCLRHADEELGHELLALHDFNALQGHARRDLPDEMPSTRRLSDYLYSVAETGNPLARLGYSFWAEDSYQYIGPMLTALKTRLAIPDEHLTFLVSHSAIDADHSRDIEHALATWVTSDDDLADVESVMVQSLDYQYGILEAVHAEWQARAGRGPGALS